MGRKVTVYKPTSVLYTKDQLMNVFKSHDADGDGKLSREELKKAFKYLGSRWVHIELSRHSGVLMLTMMGTLMKRSWKS